jgi:hypothetical protein
MLTCKHLLPVAKETLLIEPCVQLHRIHALNHQYKKHPELASKVTTLEVRANDQEGCVCTHQNGIIAYSALRGFSALLRLLPNLTTLLLGANQLKDITPLHFLLAPRGSLFCPDHSFTAPRHPSITLLPRHRKPHHIARTTSCVDSAMEQRSLHQLRRRILATPRLHFAQAPQLTVPCVLRCYKRRRPS